MIRKALPGDAAALADLAAATFPLACPPGSSPEDIQLHLRRTLSEDRFREYLADSNIAILVLEQGGRLDGYTLLVDRQSTDPDVLRALDAQRSVELSKCYVHPDHHGRGAATTLMRASLDWAAEQGAATVWLGVNSQNARAIRFYEKSGFAKVGTKSFTLGDSVENDFILEYALPGKG
ncbi:GNAT family N-acetyltransferase [Arthrobacter globiformis]|uniref:GNAT family N-acetyltransferase n=1 Tax=Arthrobacter globiformis TaxID=1665 RepID=UPI0027935ED7|nr:GNAT family N-acetyltransferase [Arthrobacter globiformis]MDQ0616400.1 ribosomal protein S18 acetylase RimI-like enzyme [Arthrobacter globiformis]